MKNTLILISLLAAGAAGAAEYTLTPSSISTSQNGSGITPSGVLGYDIPEGATLSTWYGTYQNGSLSGQVSASETDGLKLQIGAAASTNSGGNYAAVHFTTSTVGETPLTLSFDYAIVDVWGGDSSAFAASYTYTVYGFDAEGNATSLGTSSMSFLRSDYVDTDVTASVADGGAGYNKQSVTMDLDTTNGSYDSYGLIFRSMETAQSAGGIAVSFTDIAVTTKSAAIPEPTTATLSLLALAGLAARRRRK